MTRLLLMLPLLALSACDTLEDAFGSETEVEGIVAEVGASSLVVDAISYDVTPETEFEGYVRLADVAVGDAVEVEYEGGDGTRVAVEVERATGEDDD